ncbi:hypothetical protein [Pseudomonas abieticivorans]|uniref:hypothetical protein n=1 Tax=Pseudomonas abieticivorans TaxID=2931382 RepID=UPI0020BF4B31|nr:hypothetical protein [Pseudomonas sp. PIA16]
MISIDTSSSSLAGLLSGTDEPDAAKREHDLQARQAAKHKQEEKNEAARRKDRLHNKQVQQLQSTLRHKQYHFMAAQGAEYATEAERLAALIKARAGVLAAHVAINLAASPPPLAASSHALDNAQAAAGIQADA